MLRIKQLLVDGDYTALVSLIEKEIGWTGQASSLKACCRNWVKCEASWSNESWRMWLKNRAAECGFYARGLVRLPTYDFVSAVFHVGFIYLHETEEMWERLRNEPAEHAKTARSRITDSNVRLSPINRTAEKVTGIPKLSVDDRDTNS